MNEDLKRRVMENVSKPINRVPFDKDALNAANKKALDDAFGNIRQTVSNIRFVKKKSIFQIVIKTQLIMKTYNRNRGDGLNGK